MKSAPWYNAASNDYKVFSGKIEHRPRCAIFRGLPAALMYGAGLGKLNRSGVIMTKMAILLSICYMNILYRCRL